MNQPNIQDMAKNKHIYLWLDLALLLILFLQVISFIGRGEEDAYISYRYALNLDRGNGLVYNVGERVEGFSNPSWTLLLALFHYFGLPFRVSAFLMAIIFDLLIFFLIRKISIHLFSDSLIARIPLVLLSLYSYMHASFDNGLEGSIWSFCITLLLLGVTFQKKYIILTGSILAVISRPEGIVVYFISLGYLIYLLIKRKEATNLKSYSEIFISIGLVIFFFVLRYLYYQAWLPNSLMAKGAFINYLHFLRTFLENKGLTYYREYLGSIGRLNLLLSICGIFFISRKDLGFYSLALILLSFFLILKNSGDWMLDYRLLTPYFPIFTILITAGGMSIGRRFKIQTRLVFTILLLVYLFQLPDYSLWLKSIKTATNTWVKAWKIDPEDYYYALIGNTGKITVKDVIQLNEKIALEAGGLPGYILNRYYVIEMWGLTDKEIIINDNPSTYLIPHFGKANWIEVLKKDPEYLKFHSPGHLFKIIQIPGMSEKLHQYLVFQGEPAYYEKHILLIKKDNVNIPKFKAVYKYFEVNDYIIHILPKYYPNIKPLIPEHGQLVRETLKKWQVSQGTRVFTHAENHISVNNIIGVYKDGKPMKMVLGKFPANPNEAGIFYFNDWPNSHRIYINDGANVPPLGNYEIEYYPNSAGILKK